MTAVSLKILFLTLLLGALMDAQEQPDSLLPAVAGVSDSTSSASGVDTVVTYTAADSIVYSISTRTMSLFSKGTIDYRDTHLDAERIQVDWRTTTLQAEGIPDSSDTTGTKFEGTPVMKDGGEEFKGFKLSYNFQTKKGKINVGQTEMDQGYYYGEDIKRVDDRVMFVEDGRYTTCDNSNPHYYFSSPKMKVIVRDKVFAEPVYLYIADVPVFALPFAVFPNKGGRRSGLIAPAYAEDGRRGRYLRHLGYYWAISDYMDLGMSSDLYTKGSLALYADYRYAYRYKFAGSFSGDYKKIRIGEAGDPSSEHADAYNLHITHNQEIDPSTRMDVNFTFASDNSYQYTVSIPQALNQTVTSNASVSKYWEGTPNSVGLSVSRSQNLITSEVDETLPSLSFNHSQSFPFRRSSSDDLSDLNWYEMVGVSYSAQGAFARRKSATEVDNIKVAADSVGKVADFRRSRQQSVTQNVSTNIAPKLGYFTISPSLTYSDQRIFTETETPTRNASDSMVTIEEEKDATRTGTVSSGVSMSTKLYGIAQPNMLGIAAVRHTITPGFSFVHSKQIVGDNARNAQLTASMNIGNVFEMKTIPAAEGKEGKKIQLLNAGVGFSYDFTADSLRFSPIGVGYRTGIGELFNVGGGASFDMYKLEQTEPSVYRRVNKFLIQEEGRLARLTNFSVAVSTSLSGERKQGKASPASDSMAVAQPVVGGVYGLYQDEEPDFSIPWRLSVSFDYSENKVQPSPSRTFSTRGSLEFNLTEKWKFSTSGGYDFIGKEITVPNVNISRDLHCWVMNFNWTPIGPYRYYSFEIRVKAPQLQDIKLTKSGSEGRGIF